MNVCGNARKAAFCASFALCFAAALQLAAGAPRRRVALVNVAANQEAGQKAVAQLRAALAGDAAFAPVPTGPVASALEGPIALDPAAEVDAALRRADAHVATAADAHARFDYTRALEALDATEAELVAVPPTGDVISRLADLNFLRGVIYMAESDSDSAIRAFRLVRRLAPDRAEPSAVQYKRAVIEAFKAAGLPQKKTADVVMRTPFDGATVFIDGAEAGKTPLHVALEPGTHYFFARLAGYAPYGRRTDVSRGDNMVAMPIRSLPPEDEARDLRRALVGGSPGTEALRAAGAEVSRLAGASLVVLVAGAEAGDGVRAIVYDPGSARLTRWRDAGEPQQVLAALPGRIDLDPRQLPFEQPDAGPGVLPPPPPPWYKKPWGIAAITGGTVLSIAAVALAIGFGGGDSQDPLGGGVSGFPEQ